MPTKTLFAMNSTKNKSKSKTSRTTSGAPSVTHSLFSADNQELALEKDKLTEIHRNVAQERQRRADDYQKMKAEIDKVERKIEELSKYQTSLQREEKALT